MIILERSYHSLVVTQQWVAKYIRLAKDCVSDLRSLPSESILVAG